MHRRWAEQRLLIAGLTDETIADVGEVADLDWGVIVNILGVPGQLDLLRVTDYLQCCNKRASPRD